jgi:hypothetical protein
VKGSAPDASQRLEPARSDLAGARRDPRIRHARLTQTSSGQVRGRRLRRQAAGFAGLDESERHGGRTFIRLRPMRSYTTLRDVTLAASIFLDVLNVFLLLLL